LRPEPDLKANNSINISTTAVYGDATAPLGFRLGNGGAGHTGLLRELCEAFILHHDAAFRIEWVINHSRHTQIALLGDIVQVALTYEPEWEDIGIAEGWAERVTAAFHDRFMLVGPASNPANVLSGADIKIAMREIATHGERFGGADNALFHSRGDGSATHYKELQLWGLCGVDLAHARPWRRRIPLTPYEALRRASEEGAYALTDRATFLTVARDGAASHLRVYVEDGKHLVNPCAALINLKAPVNHLARKFARWLPSEEAQDIIENYGKSWKLRLPIFAPKSRTQVDRRYALAAKL
jgi:ABC-type tungstate transport system permease subunit